MTMTMTVTADKRNLSPALEPEQRWDEVNKFITF